VVVVGGRRWTKGADLRTTEAAEGEDGNGSEVENMGDVWSSSLRRRKRRRCC